MKETADGEASGGCHRNARFIRQPRTPKDLGKSKMEAECDRPRRSNYQTPTALSNPEIAEPLDVAATESVAARKSAAVQDASRGMWMHSLMGSELDRPEADVHCHDTMNTIGPQGRKLSGFAKAGCLLLLGALTWTGCSHSYVMTLTNGNRITTTGKPKLDKGTYYYKDASGREGTISAGRVRELSPASMTKEEKSRFSAPPAK